MLALLSLMTLLVILIMPPKAYIPPPSEELENYPSVALFIDRVQAAKRGFRINDNNAATIAQICIRLEGIPLAIELIASQADVMDVREILEQLQLYIHLKLQL